MKHTYCVDCGNKIFDGLTFCPKCGAKQTASFTKEETKKSPYKILQVSENAEPEVITAAYKSLSKKYHPDIDSSINSQEKMKEINWAYSILRDPEKRKAWDRSYPRKTSKPKETQRQKTTSAYSDDPRRKYQERYDKKYSPDQSWPKQPQAKKTPKPPTRKKSAAQPKTSPGGQYPCGLIAFIIIGAIVVISFIGYLSDPLPSINTSKTSTPRNTKTTDLSNKTPRSPTLTPRPPTPTSTFSSIEPPYFEDFSSGPGIWSVGEDDEVSFSVSNEQYLIKGLGGYSFVGADLENVIFEFRTSFQYSSPSPDAGFLVKFRCYFKNECYTMVVNEQGYLGVVRGEEYIVTEKPSAKINLYDHPNDWAIIMDGEKFEILCNGELITAFSDNNYRRGDIGFGVYNSDGVEFDNIWISSLR